MNTRFLSSTALATLMIAPIAGIAAYQLMQLRDTSPMIVGQTEIAEVKKDTGKYTPLGNKIVAADKKAAAPTASPAKPAELVKERPANPIEFLASYLLQHDPQRIASSQGQPQSASVRK